MNEKKKNLTSCITYPITSFKANESKIEEKKFQVTDTQGVQ